MLDVILVKVIEVYKVVVVVKIVKELVWCKDL